LEMLEMRPKRGVRELYSGHDFSFSNNFRSYGSRINSSK